MNQLNNVQIKQEFRNISGLDDKEYSYYEKLSQIEKIIREKQKIRRIGSNNFNIILYLMNDGY